MSDAIEERAAAIMREETGGANVKAHSPAIRAMLRFAEERAQAARQELAQIYATCADALNWCRELSIVSEQARIDRPQPIDASAAGQDKRDKDNPCAQALDDLWRDIILKRKPDYGDWEYPAQAYRHLLAEFNELASAAQPAKEEAPEMDDWDWTKTAAALKSTPPAPTDAEVRRSGPRPMTDGEIREWRESEAETLERAAEIMDANPGMWARGVSPRSFSSGLRLLADGLRSAPAEEPKAKACVHELTDCPQCSPAPPAASEQDVFEAFGVLAESLVDGVTIEDDEDAIIKLAREWFGPLVEALERIVAVPVHPDPDYSKRIARSALSSLRARREQGA